MHSKLGLGIERVLYGLVAFKKFRLHALLNICACFDNHIEQGSSSPSLADFKRGRIKPFCRGATVHSHQYVNTKLVVLMNRSKIRRAQLTPDDFCSQRFDHLEQIINPSECLIHIAEVSVSLGDVMQGQGLAPAILHSFYEWQRLLVM